MAKVTCTVRRANKYEMWLLCQIKKHRKEDVPEGFFAAYTAYKIAFEAYKKFKRGKLQ